MDLFVDLPNSYRMHLEFSNRSPYALAYHQWLLQNVSSRHSYLLVELLGSQKEFSEAP